MRCEECYQRRCTGYVVLKEQEGDEEEGEGEGEEVEGEG